MHFIGNWEALNAENAPGGIINKLIVIVGAENKLKAFILEPILYMRENIYMYISLSTQY